MPPVVVFNTHRNPNAAQGQIAPIRLANHASKETQEQIGPHSIVARAASSGSGDHSGPFLVAFIGLASLVAIFVLGGSIYLIRYRLALSGRSTRTTKCVKPSATPTRFYLRSRLGTKKATKTAPKVDPQYIIHRGAGGIIHCQTPPPANLKGILLMPDSNDKVSKELVEDFEPQLPQTPPRYRIPSMAFDPCECSIGTIPQAPDNSLVYVSLDHSLLSTGSLERASSADAYPLTEASINGFMLTRTSIESSTYPRTPSDDVFAPQPAIDSPQKSKVAERGGLFRQLSTKKPTLPIPSSPTPPRLSKRPSSSPSLLPMIKAGSMATTSSSSSKTTTDVEEIVLDISTRKKTATDVLFGTWRPPSIIISPPTNSTLALRNSLPSHGSLSSTVYARHQLEKEKVDQPMWQTSTPPRKPSRSTRRTSVQRSISST